MPQKMYLYGCHLVPTLLALYYEDLMIVMLVIDIFYLLSSGMYIRFLSIEKSSYPYIVNELSRLREQIHKGLVLGISAFLLIMVYGVIFIKIGKVALPSQVSLGSNFKQ